jgi:hypothetical protein
VGSLFFGGTFSGPWLVRLAVGHGGVAGSLFPLQFFSAPEKEFVAFLLGFQILYF